MSVVVLLIVGMLVTLGAVALPGLAYAALGDDMPEWLEDWAPLMAVVMAMSGVVVIFIAMGILIAQST